MTKNLLNKFDHDFMVKAGDFNFYMNPKLDKIESMTNKHDNNIDRLEIESMLECLSLNDVWRTLNPTLRRYTWHARGKSSRFDYFFISEHLLNEINYCKIIVGLHSDHSIICLELNTNKFNTTLLKNTEYVNTVKQLIKGCEIQHKENKNKGLALELTKLKIRSFSIPFYIKKCKEAQAYKLALNNELELLQERLDLSQTKEKLERFTATKDEVEQIEMHETHSRIFRSKTHWIEEGEKNSKYFLNLEKEELHK